MKNNLYLLSLLILFVFILITSCSKDDCTELTNVPKWDPVKSAFINNYIEVPCGSGKPADGPVN